MWDSLFGSTSSKFLGLRCSTGSVRAVLGRLSRNKQPFALPYAAFGTRCGVNQPLAHQRKAGFAAARRLGDKLESDARMPDAIDHDRALKLFGNRKLVHFLADGTVGIIAAEQVMPFARLERVGITPAAHDLVVLDFGGDCGN